MKLWTRKDVFNTILLIGIFIIGTVAFVGLVLFLIEKYGVVVEERISLQEGFLLILFVGGGLSLLIYPLVLIPAKHRELRMKALDKKIEEERKREKEFWSKHTFFGKVVEDATGKVVEEWSNNGRA